MFKITIVAIFFLLNFYSGEDKSDPIHMVIEPKENNKQQGFEKFFSKFIDDINTKNREKVDQYIVKENGLYVIYNVGTFDTVRYFSSFKEFLQNLDYTTFSLYRTYKNNEKVLIDIDNKQLKYHKPNQCIQKMCNCSNEIENNYFILDKKGHKGFINQMQENDKIGNYPSEHEIIKKNMTKLRDIESKIDRIIYIDGFYFFFIKNNDHWYLAGLDISECGEYSNK